MWSGKQQEAPKERLLAQFEAMYEELYAWCEAHPEASFPEDYRFVTK
jgi:hypothetical protein